MELLFRKILKLLTKEYGILIIIPLCQMICNIDSAIKIYVIIY